MDRRSLPAPESISVSISPRDLFSVAGRPTGSRPGLAAAKWAGTSLDLERSLAFKTNYCLVGLAIVGIVDAPRPGIAVGFHVGKDRQAQYSPIGERRVGVLVVYLRFARIAIYRLLEPNDAAANAGAASGNLDLGVSGAGQPDP